MNQSWNRDQSVISRTNLSLLYQLLKIKLFWPHGRCFAFLYHRNELVSSPGKGQWLLSWTDVDGFRHTERKKMVLSSQPPTLHHSVCVHHQPHCVCVCVIMLTFLDIFLSVFLSSVCSICDGVFCPSLWCRSDWDTTLWHLRGPTYSTTLWWFHTSWTGAGGGVPVPPKHTSAVKMAAQMLLRCFIYLSVTNLKHLSRNRSEIRGRGLKDLRAWSHTCHIFVY